MDLVHVVHCGLSLQKARDALKEADLMVAGSITKKEQSKNMKARAKKDAALMELLTKVVSMNQEKEEEANKKNIKTQTDKKKKQSKMTHTLMVAMTERITVPVPSFVAGIAHIASVAAGTTFGGALIGSHNVQLGMTSH